MISFFSWIRFDQILDAGYKNLWNFSAMISEAWKDFPKWEFWQKVIGKASTMWKQFKFWVQNVAVDWTCSTHLFPWGSIALSRCNTCTLWKQKFQRRRAHNTCTYVCNACTEVSQYLHWRQKCRGRRSPIIHIGFFPPALSLPSGNQN